MWRWSTDLCDALPGDPQGERHSRSVAGCAWVGVLPQPTAAPSLQLWSPAVAALLGDPQPPAEAADWLGGAAQPHGSRPFAAAYGGHQFGHWAGQLGDGRAISLGQIDGPEGRQELQLKGAGRTPFSRGADGRAVLRSSLREFVASEAMHHLGIPTTRALSLVLSGDAVIRDRFYDGHPAAEPGAVLARVAPSFVRFGTFELPAARDDRALLSAWVDYTCTRFFSQLPRGTQATRLVALFDEICSRTEALVVHWQRVGFVHGVLNSDNMSALGLTLDYGPFGFLEPFDPSWTPNTTDAEQCRYAYGQQPAIAVTNLAFLARALLPLLGAAQPLQARLDACGPNLQAALRQMWLDKLGLQAESPAADEALLGALFAWLAQRPADMTLLFRALGGLDLSGVTRPTAVTAWLQQLRPVFYGDPDLTAAAQPQLHAWLRLYCRRAVQQVGDPQARRAAMAALNPALVPRNYLLQGCIEAAEQGDFAPTRRLIAALQTPYVNRPQDADYHQRRPEWATQAPACSRLSCSS